jgi:transcriptional regulator with XRE-family HTH domain
VKDQARQLLGPGMLRRIRRTADVSQRELAAMLGVAPSTVGRWEAGENSPDLETVARLAGIAGLRLALVDPDDRVVAPMAEDAMRDRGGRRFPAHLDGWAVGAYPVRFLHRGVYRDVLRRCDGTPTDHPPAGTRDETPRSAGRGPD